MVVETGVGLRETQFQQLEIYDPFKNEPPKEDNSDASVGRPGRAEPTIATPQKPRPENDGVTEPMSFATFNTYGYKNVNVDAELDVLFETNDIIGTQEQDETELGRTINRHSHTHGVITGNPTNNEDRQYSPIFYDKEKYEPVAVENIDLPPNGERAATIAVLRDKKSGALITVSNSHFVNDGADPTGKLRRESFEKVADAHLQMAKKYNTAGDVFMGDFNDTSVRNDPRMGDYKGKATHDDTGVVFDGVGVSNEKDATDPLIRDGGASDHNSVSRTVRFDYNTKEAEEDRKNVPALKLPGVVLFSADGYGGRADIIGFGGDDHGDISNDTTSSMYVADNTRVTVKDHSNGDSRQAGGGTFVFDGSVTTMPEGWNDRVSNVVVTSQG